MVSPRWLVRHSHFFFEIFFFLSNPIPATAAQQVHPDAQESRVPLAHFDRAITEGSTEGFVSLLHRGDAGVILGCAAVGDGVGDLVAELGLAVNNKTSMKNLCVVIPVHRHPLCSDGLKVFGLRFFCAGPRRSIRTPPWRSGCR